MYECISALTDTEMISRSSAYIYAIAFISKKLKRIKAVCWGYSIIGNDCFRYVIIYLNLNFPIQEVAIHPADERPGAIFP